MAHINQRPSFMIEDLLECHKRLEEAKRLRALEHEAEIQRNMQKYYQLNHSPVQFLGPNLSGAHSPYLTPHTSPSMIDFRRFSSGEVSSPNFYSSQYPHIDQRSKFIYL